MLVRELPQGTAQELAMVLTQPFLSGGATAYHGLEQCPLG